MKAIKNSIAIVLMVGIVQSCSKENLQIPEHNEEVTILEAVAKLGFDTTRIMIKGDNIFVEEDIVLKKEKLLQTTPRQAIVAGKTQLYSPVKYHISSSITNHRPIQQAFQEYINYVKNVQWIRVFNENEADIVVRGYEEVSNVCGYAEWPTVGYNLGLYGLFVDIGESIYINKYHWKNMSTSQRKTLIAHEIGHTLGIRHTNWRQLGEPEFIPDASGGTFGAYTVSGTNNTSLNPDPKSIFNGGTCGRSWDGGFRQWDYSAIFYATATNIGNP